MLLREGQTAFSDVISNIPRASVAFLVFTGRVGGVFGEARAGRQIWTARSSTRGYVLLLKSLDEPVEECGTKMARLLKPCRSAAS